MAASHSLFAVEVALKLRLERAGGFRRLIAAVIDEGLISAEVAEIVDAGSGDPHPVRP